MFKLLEKQILKWHNDQEFTSKDNRILCASLKSLKFTKKIFQILQLILFKGTNKTKCSS